MLVCAVIMNFLEIAKLIETIWIWKWNSSIEYQEIPRHKIGSVILDQHKKPNKSKFVWDAHFDYAHMTFLIKKIAFENFNLNYMHGLRYFQKEVSLSL